MTDHVLSVIHCSKTYTSGLHAVKDVTFTIKPGQFTVLLGLNGAGKSSLISMITGLSHITHGQILIQGFDVEKQAFDAKKHFGICPQEVNFNHFHSIEQELIIAAGLQGMTRQQAIRTAKPLLEKARLWQKRHDIIRNLSGGMKRILMVIRALLHQPALLILDEPTAGLDIEIRDFIWDLLKNTHAQNTAVLLTTHNMAEAQHLCQNVLLLEKGKLLLDQPIRTALSSLSLKIYHLHLEKPLTDQQRQQLTDAHIQYQRTHVEHEILLETRQESPLEHALQALIQLNVRITHIAPAKNELEQLLQETSHRD